MADLKTVCDYLTPSEILAQLGEECAEGAQAALKLRRAYDGTNPTPQKCGRLPEQSSGRICRYDAVSSCVL